LLPKWILAEASSTAFDEIDRDLLLKAVSGRARLTRDMGIFVEEEGDLDSFLGRNEFFKEPELGKKKI
jgi:predicted RNA-binding protein (virulence factor B family)